MVWLTGLTGVGTIRESPVALSTERAGKPRLRPMISLTEAAQTLRAAQTKGRTTAMTALESADKQGEMKVVVTEEMKVVVTEEMKVVVTEEMKVVVTEEMKVAGTEETVVVVTEEMKVVVTEETVVVVTEEMKVVVTEEMKVAGTEETVVERAGQTAATRMAARGPMKEDKGAPIATATPEAATRAPATEGQTLPKMLAALKTAIPKVPAAAGVASRVQATVQTAVLTPAVEAPVARTPLAAEVAETKVTREILTPRTMVRPAVGVSQETATATPAAVATELRMAAEIVGVEMTTAVEKAGSEMVTRREEEGRTVEPYPAAKTQMMEEIGAL